MEQSSTSVVTEVRSWEVTTHSMHSDATSLIGASHFPLSDHSTKKYPIGSRVVICNLQYKPALNGQLGVVEEFVTELERYRVRPLGKQAQELIKTRSVAIDGRNIRIVPQSAFIARVKIHDSVMPVPLSCRVIVDQNSHLAVQLMYDDFLGLSVVQTAINVIEGPFQEWAGNGTVMLGVITTPVNKNNEFVYRRLRGMYEDDYDSERLLGSQVLILPEKPAICSLYQDMIDYEVVRKMQQTVDCGIHGSVPLSRLLFPFTVEQS